MITTKASDTNIYTNGRHSRRWQPGVSWPLLAVVFAVWFLCAGTARAQPLSPASTYNSLAADSLPARRIPKIVHFVYGLHSPDPELDLMQYISIAAAWETIKPERVFFWYHYEPKGHYWNLVKERFITDQRSVRMVDEIFGNNVEHYAHKADVIRLEALKEVGGIYLDMDVIMLRGVDDLLDNEFVMGEEGEDARVGLCNAVILAQANSTFLQLWYDSYKTFKDSQWNDHSVLLPKRLAYQYGESIHVLPYTSFFWPLWTTQGMQRLYTEKTYQFVGSGAYAVHLWENVAMNYALRGVDVATIEGVPTALFCTIRKYLRVKGRMETEADRLAAASEEQDPNCVVPDEPRRADGLIGLYNFENDDLAPPVLHDASSNNMHGWFLSSTRRNTLPKSVFFESKGDTKSKSELELVEHSNTSYHLQSPAGEGVRAGSQALYFDGRGDFAVLPTLPHGFNLHAFTLDFWLRIPSPNYTEFSRKSEMQHKTVMAVVTDGDWNDPPNSDEHPGTTVHIHLQKFKPPPVPKLGNDTTERWMLEFSVKGTKAAAAHWAVRNPELGLKANEWYRIHATASRDTQRLTLQIGYPKNHNGPLLRNPPVDKNTGLTFVRESKFYTPNIIQPSRVKAVWLAAHPPPFMNVDRNTIWDFRGWMDDLVIANKVVSPSQVDDWLKEAADTPLPKSSNRVGIASDLITVTAPGDLGTGKKFPDEIEIKDMDEIETNGLESETKIKSDPETEMDESYELLKKLPEIVHPVSPVDSNNDDHHAVKAEDYLATNITAVNSGMESPTTASEGLRLWLLINLDLLPILIYMARSKKPSRSRSYNLFCVVLFINLTTTMLNSFGTPKSATAVSRLGRQSSPTKVMRRRRAPPDLENDLLWKSDSQILATEPPDMIALNLLGYDSRGPEMKAKKASPVVSVIIPCYNQAQYVQDAIASVLNQTYPFWDMAIFDDGSPDECSTIAQNILKRYFPQHGWKTTAIADSYQPLADAIATRGGEELVLLSPRPAGADHTETELSYMFPRFAYEVTQLVAPDVNVVDGEEIYTPSIRIFKKPNTGLSATRNFALHHMRNPWVCLLDADDRVHHRYFQLTMHYLLEENPAYRLMTTNQQFFQDSDWIWAIPQHWSAMATLSKGPFPVSTLFKRDDWRIVKGGFNPMLPWGNEDWSFWISLSWLPGMKVGKVNKQTVINCLRDLKIERNLYQAIVGVSQPESHLVALPPGKITLLDRRERQNLGVTFASWRSILLARDMDQLKSMSWIGTISNYDRPRPTAAERRQGKVFPKHDGLAFSLYRFKKQSMQRTKERHNSEVMPLMRTLHPFEYGVTKILQDHVTLLSLGKRPDFHLLTQATFNEITHMVNQFKYKVDLTKSTDLGANRHGLGAYGEAGLWLGLRYESYGDIATAQQSYIRALSQREQGRRILLGIVHDQQVSEDVGESEPFNLEQAVARIAESTIVGGATERDWQLWWRLGIVTHQLLAGGGTGTANRLPDSGINGDIVSDVSLDSTVTGVGAVGNNSTWADLFLFDAAPLSISVSVTAADKFCEVAAAFAGEDLEQYMSKCTDPDPPRLPVARKSVRKVKG